MFWDFPFWDCGNAEDLHAYAGFCKLVNKMESELKHGG